MSQQEEQFPAVGGRFQLKQAVDRFPDFLAPAGITGTIRTCEPGFIELEMDIELKQLPEGREIWGNCIHWYPDSNPGKSLTCQFLDDCTPISTQDCISPE